MIIEKKATIKRSPRGHYKTYDERKHPYPIRITGRVLKRLKQESNKSATVERALIAYFSM